MLIRLPITQIANYWGMIKTCGVMTDGITPEQEAHYAKNLYLRLYKEDIICVLKCTPQKEIQAIILIGFKINTSTGVKVMQIRNLYGLTPVDTDDWLADFKRLLKFAKDNGCVSVEAESPNPRVWEILSREGFKLQAKQYSLTL